jgi:hypothetical protein
MNTRLLFLRLLAAAALDSRLYADEPDAATADMSALVTLSRNCDDLLHHVEEHFKAQYMRTRLNTLLMLDPYFLLAWTVSVLGQYCDTETMCAFYLFNCCVLVLSNVLLYNTT